MPTSATSMMLIEPIGVDRLEIDVLVLGATGVGGAERLALVGHDDLGPVGGERDHVREGNRRSPHRWPRRHRRR